MTLLPTVPWSSLPAKPFLAFLIGLIYLPYILLGGKVRVGTDSDYIEVK